MLRSGGNIPAGTGNGEPETLNVFFCQGHGGIETNDGEVSGNVKNDLDDGFPGFGVEIIDLGRIVPGHGSSVISMVNKSVLVGPFILVQEYHRGVGAIVVVVFQLDFHIGILG